MDPDQYSPQVHPRDFLVCRIWADEGAMNHISVEAYDGTYVSLYLNVPLAEGNCRNLIRTFSRRPQPAEASPLGVEYTEEHPPTWTFHFPRSYSYESLISEFGGQQPKWKSELRAKEHVLIGAIYRVMLIGTNGSTGHGIVLDGVLEYRTSTSPMQDYDGMIDYNNNWEEHYFRFICPRIDITPLRSYQQRQYKDYPQMASPELCLDLYAGLLEGRIEEAKAYLRDLVADLSPEQTNMLISYLDKNPVPVPARITQATTEELQSQFPEHLRMSAERATTILQERNSRGIARVNLQYQRQLKDREDREGVAWVIGWCFSLTIIVPAAAFLYCWYKRKREPLVSREMPVSEYVQYKTSRLPKKGKQESGLPKTTTDSSTVLSLLPETTQATSGKTAEQPASSPLTDQQRPIYQSLYQRLGISRESLNGEGLSRRTIRIIGSAAKMKAFDQRRKRPASDPATSAQPN